MPKRTWEVARPPRARCEVCEGAFGLTRRRFEQKQFCSKHCLEWYVADGTNRVSSFKRSPVMSRRQTDSV